MVLTENEISAKGLVDSLTQSGNRNTTYDATIGKIITKNGEYAETSYNLPPRGIAWLVSEESFNLPNEITGLATLRTTWTHQGILTLTLGVIDPGWNGPLSTAVINFGKNDFPIVKGDRFFRILFFEHKPTNAEDIKIDKGKYCQQVITQSKDYSETFLTIDTLAPELLRAIFDMPRWGVYIGLAALVIALMSIVIPIGSGLSSEVFQKRAELRVLETRIEKLESLVKSTHISMEIPQPIVHLPPDEIEKPPAEENGQQNPQ